jgi:hypothetical protein
VQVHEVLRRVLRQGGGGDCGYGHGHSEEGSR